MRLLYQINNYNNDGSLIDKCIWIHFDEDHIILNFKNLDEYKYFINELERMKSEIESNWNYENEKGK